MNLMLARFLIMIVSVTVIITLGRQSSCRVWLWRKEQGNSVEESVR